MWKQCETTFNLDRHLVTFLQENAFYAELSRHIRKTPTLDMPTAGVAYDDKADEITLYYNPEFFGKLSNWEVRGVLMHEFNHLVFGHLVARRKTPHKLWNIATDLAINSLIIAHAGRRRDNDPSDARPLPKCALIPGSRPQIDEETMTKATPEQKAALTEFANIIEKLPKDQASEWYFNKLQQIAKDMQDKGKQKSKGKGSPGKGTPGKGDPSDSGEPTDGEGDDGGGDQDGEGEGESDIFDKLFGGAGDPMDEHDGWDSMPDEVREYVEGKIKSIVEKAVTAADSRADGWGNIPANIQAEIRKSVNGVVNWRTVLRQFVGNLVRGERTTSIKRINRRYPYIHPGVKRGYTARLCIAIDQSGSVDNTQLAEFFAELESLTKRVTVDIMPFDCVANESDIFTWRRGAKVEAKRVRGGGTDFNAPTRILNDPKNRGRWDGMLIMTDGECTKPEGSRVKRGWVLSKGHKLLFDSDEVQVFLDESKPMTGAWR